MLSFRVQKIKELQIPHATSPLELLTISCGISFYKPSITNTPQTLTAPADWYFIKPEEIGRNKAIAFDISMGIKITKVGACNG